MSFIFKEFDHVQLAAPKGSEEKARLFYSEILRFDEIEKPEVLKKRGGVWFAFGTLQIHIGIEEPFSPAKKAHPGIRIQHLFEFKKHLSKMRIPFIEDDNLKGANRIYVNDPFGNRLEFLEWKEENSTIHS